MNRKIHSRTTDGVVDEYYHSTLSYIRSDKIRKPPLKWMGLLEMILLQINKYGECINLYIPINLTSHTIIIPLHNPV